MLHVAECRVCVAEDLGEPEQIAPIPEAVECKLHYWERRGLIKVMGNCSPPSISLMQGFVPSVCQCIRLHYSHPVKWEQIISFCSLALHSYHYFEQLCVGLYSWMWLLQLRLTGISEVLKLASVNVSLIVALPLFIVHCLHRKGMYTVYISLLTFTLVRKFTFHFSILIFRVVCLSIASAFCLFIRDIII